MNPGMGIAPEPSTAAYQSLVRRRRDFDAIKVATGIAFVLFLVLAWSRQFPPRAMTDPHSTSRVQ